MQSHGMSPKVNAGSSVHENDNLGLSQLDNTNELSLSVDKRF